MKQSETVWNPFLLHQLTTDQTAHNNRVVDSVSHSATSSQSWLSPSENNLRRDITWWPTHLELLHTADVICSDHARHFQTGVMSVRW